MSPSIAPTHFLAASAMSIASMRLVALDKRFKFGGSLRRESHASYTPAKRLQRSGNCVLKEADERANEQQRLGHAFFQLQPLKV